MTPLIIALLILGVMLTHFGIALGAAFAALGWLCLVAAGVIAVTRRGARLAAHLSTLEMGLVTVGLCMVVSASTIILWKIFGA